MALFGPYIFMLGLFVAQVTAQTTTSNPSNETATAGATLTAVTLTSTDANNTRTVNFSSSTSNPSPIPITATGTPGSRTTQNDRATSPKTFTPGPGGVEQTTPKDNGGGKDLTTTPQSQNNETTGIVIIAVIAIIAIGFCVACFFSRKRGRHYSIDLTSRPDEANIPLSTVEPEPLDNGPQNGLQTFESVDTTAKESTEPNPKPEVQEEKEADPEKSAEPAADPAASASSSGSSGDKSKEDVVEASPPAPVEPSADEKTDDEGAVSTKTSVESLKEANENNSNSADLKQRTDLMSNNSLWDVPLDSPV